ncbi:MAG TPA: valine--tRNA ligase [Candidatus Moranbacteria bacterium]|nr:valine--tRNA ligase [Candidatus Moranbacteria bacterium]HRZ33912.1 valine--tRNA ligase [Candidatus Moranbacteria bacterium]
MKNKGEKESYIPQNRESYWQNFWENEKINRFDPDSIKPLFTIDTPPPTISGSLHLGHVFSYTQAEVIARFRRLAGFNVRYPMGYDNNGLPTERLVEKEHNIQGSTMPLAEFVKICLEVTEVYKKKYTNLWKSLGLSIDWDLSYSSISTESQKLAQTVFKELYEKDAIYQKEAVALYCHNCHTSVAQAEVEDKEIDAMFYDIVFTCENGEELIISTTRPELLPAIVAVFVHPEDERYLPQIGKFAISPLGKKVTIIADDKVSVEKGTGAVMCCTYGDETDVFWKRKHNLPEKIIFTPEGKISYLEDFPEIAGKTIGETRKIIISKLRELNAIRKEQPIKHDVGVHERCGVPIELIPTKQWFVKVLDKKEDLLDAGRKIIWHPEYMRKRYEEWVSGLKWDWCISRERFFGVPIPAYVCDSCGHVFIPETESLPVNPKIDTEIHTCDYCGKGKMIPEKNVLDTWFTSALTPDINNYFPGNGKLTGKMYPMSMRPQGHDIIRTWVMYSVLMAFYRHQNIPWRELMISGHLLLRKGEKISKKTGGGKHKPEELIAEHSADAIRYTMYGATLGRDAFYDELEVKKGKKLITKIYNAGKLILDNLRDYKGEKISELEAIDRWIINRAHATAATMAKEFERYEYSHARQTFEEWFWNDLCDNYLEIVKGRLWTTEDSSQTKRLSAQYALYHVYLIALKMISPLLPHITEEMFHAELSPEGKFTSDIDSGFFAHHEGINSIHLTDWPTGETNLLNKDESIGMELMLKAISAVRKYKTSIKLSANAQLPPIILKGTKEEKYLLLPFWNDLVFVARAESITFQENDSENEITNNPVIMLS